MANAEPAQTTRVEQPVFLFDGDCAFCSSCARFIDRHLARGIPVLPWQRTDLDVLDVTAAQAEASVVWVGTDRVVALGPVAIARLLRHAGRAWYPFGWLLETPPVRAMAWPIYRWVARNRHRMPGGTAACSLPQAERESTLTDSDRQIYAKASKFTIT